MLNPNLTTFLAVADCGSFNRASERLYISPPSVMKQINALEKHLELTLFTRTSQGIQLTAAGQVLYRRTKELAGFAAGALEEARRASVQAENTLCIGSSILNPCKPFMDLWYQVSQAFPGYKLHIVPFEDNHQGILAEIASLGKKFDFLVGGLRLQALAGPVQLLPAGHLPALLRRIPGAPPGKKEAPDHPGSLWADPDDGQAGGLFRGGQHPGGDPGPPPDSN